MLFKITIREIRQSLGRYIAIIAIVTLGVGFFAGLVQNKDVMVTTVDKLLNKSNLHDFEMISNFGFTRNDIEKVKSSIDDSKFNVVEGFKFEDFIYHKSGHGDKVVRAIALPEQNIDLPKISSGKIPLKDGECIVDEKYFDKSDLGTFIELKEDISSDKFPYGNGVKFRANRFKIVGLCTSPLYLNAERGYSNLGSGTVSSFIYINKDDFTSDYFTSIVLSVKDRPKIYSEEYNKLIENLKPQVERVMKEVTNNRQTQGEKTKSYLLDRNSNVGYKSFENDADIIRGIANVFPAFFFIVAALVVMTTIARLVEEQRTEIGVLKALGYTDGRILSKYLFYSTSATLIGSILGFISGSYIFPTTIWNAYRAAYNFNIKIIYPSNYQLALGTLVVCLIGCIVATLLAFIEDRKGMPAALLIPKAPREGKRIFLEKISFIWKRFSFLYKVTFRNIFRYKKRLFMMLLGIGGCTALLLTGFGINDSIKNIADYQYKDIFKYDYSITFNQNMTGKENEFLKAHKDIDEVLFYRQETVKYQGNKSINLELISTGDKKINKYINLSQDKNAKKQLNLPDNKQVVICDKLAKENKIKVGDTISLKTEDNIYADLKVAGITRNYIGNYVYISSSAYKSVFDKEPELNSAIVRVNSNSQLDSQTNVDKLSQKDLIYKSASNLAKDRNVSSTNINQDSYTRIVTMMNSLNSVIVVICLAAAGLAFIVLYNLSNISITERIREIATIKVLGFYPLETALYILREIIFLAALGALVGLGLGRGLHQFVMDQIKVEMIFFPLRISWYSYIYSFLLAMAFAYIINAIMYLKIKKIDMIESLKCVE